MAPNGDVSINKYVGDFIKQQVDNYLHKNPDVAEVMQQKITESERERKAMAGVTKLARERAKKANLHKRSCAIAVSIIAIRRTTAKRRVPSSSLKATRQVEASPRAATLTRRPCSLCAENRSTRSDSPKRWFTKTRSSTCCKPH